MDAQTMKSIEDMQDGLRRSARSSLAAAVLTKEIDGVKLSCQVSPCSWMHENYGLQVEVTMAGGGGRIYIHSKSVLFSSATEADVRKLVDTVRICTCRTCGKPAFDPSSVQTNRNGECEACFMSKLKRDFDEVLAREEAAKRALDAKRKKQGYTYRVEAFVHPSGGGDDYEIRIYTKRYPGKDFVEQQLRKAKSSVLDDYKITAL